MVDKKLFFMRRYEEDNDEEAINKTIALMTRRNPFPKLAKPKKETGDDSIGELIRFTRPITG